jgi:hypothetical protein
MSLLSKAIPMSKEAAKEVLLKLFIYGEKSTGKTHLALNAPGPIFFIDTEHGTDPFLRRTDFGHLLDGKNKVVHSTSVLEVTETLKELAGGSPFKTVVIDSLTTLYYTLQNAHLGKQGKPETSDWNVIKLAWKDMVVALANVPCHVIACSQEKAGVKGVKVNGFMKYEQEITYDCDDSTPYFADLGLRFTRQGKVVTGEVTKEDRYGRFPMAKTIPGVTFERLLQGISAPGAATVKPEASMVEYAKAAAPAPAVNKASTVEKSYNQNELRDLFTQLATKEAVKVEYEKLKTEGNYELETLKEVFREYWQKLPSEKVSA